MKTWVFRSFAVIPFVLAPMVSGQGDADEPIVRKVVIPEWDFAYRVLPSYPPDAARHHVQGTVKFQALIAKDGRIERLRLISGHPLLVGAAKRAAQKWVCRPTLLNGKPVRVIGLINVEFQLNAAGKTSRADASIHTTQPPEKANGRA